MGATAGEHPRLSLIQVATSSSHDKGLHEPLSLQKDLLAWFDSKPERSVPWRRTGLSHQTRKHMNQEELFLYAYQIWVSEIMCQQTRLETAVPFYERWMARFPTLNQLAEASVEEVRENWTGLGYYNRATRLLQGAQKVVNDFNSQIPQDPNTLQKDIPGIGPYTAAAITSIVFGEPIAAVDGNVQRVYSRVFGIYAPPAAKATINHLQDLANKTISTDRPGDYNQALMDLGFSICTPKNPSCTDCPLKSKCVAYAQERLSQSDQPSVPDIEAAALGQCTLCSPLPETSTDVTRYPMPKEKKKSKEDDCAVCLLEWQPSTESQKKEYLLLKRPERGLLAGMWELPSCDLDTESESAERLTALQAVLKKAVSTPVKLANHRELDTVIHKFSHITRSYKPIHVSVISKQRPELHLSKSKAVWLDAESVLSSNIPGAIKTVFTHFLNSGATKGGKKRKAPGGKSSKLVDKSQKSLSGFFVKRQDGKKTEQSVSSKVETSQESVSPSKARKVRVIADSDED